MSKANVLLVILDSVRARNTSLHRHGNRTTPYLEEFANEALVYEQARAPSIHSVSSHASIFTGYHVPEHGVTAHEGELNPTSTIWHELSKKHGYVTGLFSPNVIVTVTSNLAESFDTVDGPKKKIRNRLFNDALAPSDVEGHQNSTEYLRRCIYSGTPFRAVINGLFFQYGKGSGNHVDESAPVYIDSFLNWSDSIDGPWAACLNLMDAHYPYTPDSEYDEWGSSELQEIHDSLSTPPSKEIVANQDWWKLQAIESLYDGAIRQVDASIKHLIDGLVRRNLLEDTLLVITSDHGEGFGEWSRVAPDVRMVDHSWGIHESLTHVPLIVRNPGNGEGHRVSELASLTRFPAVVREFLDGQKPSFVVDDYALASTYRLEEPKKVLPSDVSNRQKFAGPWQAVYEWSDNGVRKHIAGGGNDAQLSIPDAQTAVVLDSSGGELVEEIYGGITNANVKQTTRMDRILEDDIEQQLEELGYLR